MNIDELDEEDTNDGVYQVHCPSTAFSINYT